jgi:hypothetical protein
LHTYETAPWHALITAAEVSERRCLPEDLERYVATLLTCYIGRPAYIVHAPTRDWIAAALASSPRDPDDLRVLADRCLLFAGLFSEHALRSSVSLGQYVAVGRRAYARLGAAGERIFTNLSERFVDAMDVLQALRELDGGHPGLDPLAALQLWHDTGSQHAWRSLRARAHGLPAPESRVLIH